MTDFFNWQDNSEADSLLTLGAVRSQALGLPQEVPMDVPGLDEFNQLDIGEEVEVAQAERKAERRAQALEVLGQMMITWSSRDPASTAQRFFELESNKREQERRRAQADKLMEKKHVQDLEIRSKDSAAADARIERQIEVQVEEAEKDRKFTTSEREETQAVEDERISVEQTFRQNMQAENNKHGINLAELEARQRELLSRTNYSLSEAATIKQEIRLAERVSLERLTGELVNVVPATELDYTAQRLHLFGRGKIDKDELSADELTAMVELEKQRVIRVGEEDRDKRLGVMGAVVQIMGAGQTDIGGSMIPEAGMAFLTDQIAEASSDPSKIMSFEVALSRVKESAEGGAPIRAEELGQVVYQINQLTSEEAKREVIEKMVVDSPSVARQLEEQYNIKKPTSPGGDKPLIDTYLDSADSFVDSMGLGVAALAKSAGGAISDLYNTELPALQRRMNQ